MLIHAEKLKKTMVMNVSEVRAMKTSCQLTQGLVKALKLCCEIFEINPVEKLVVPHQPMKCFVRQLLDML